jgi:uncharacterized RDD family membrane protein YckC
MVIEDLSKPLLEHKKLAPVYQADPAERMISFLIDSALVAPIVTLVCSVHLKEIGLDEAQGFSSSLIYSMWITAAFTSISLQSLFLYFIASTPGQAFLNLKVQSIETEKLEWGACFLRSITFHFSFLLMMVPFFEVLTHSMGRCAHDRISDTIVVQAHATQRLRLSAQARWNLKFITFMFFFCSFSVYLIEADESFSNPSLQTSSEFETLDQVVSQALLLKKFDVDTQKKVDELLWKAKTKNDQALAYFYRFKSTDKKSDQLLISHQICENKSKSLCQLSRAEMGLETKKIEFDENQSLSVLIALMQYSAKVSDFKSAYLYHKKLKDYGSLSEALKIWDVSLFLKSIESPEGQRQPASVNPDFDELSPEEPYQWVEKFKLERGQL